MTGARSVTLIKLAEYTTKMYDDTKEVTDVAYIIASLVEELNARISDEELAKVVDKVISDSENNT